MRRVRAKDRARRSVECVRRCARWGKVRECVGEVRDDNIDAKGSAKECERHGESERNRGERGALGRKFFETTHRFSERVDGMIRHSVQWREVVGADNFSKKVDQALTAETQTIELLRTAEEELTKVRSDLDKM